MSIASDRALWKAQGLDVVTREEWGAQYPDYDKPRAVQDIADSLFLHITVTTPRDDEKAHMRYIERIGLGRKFPGVSYNAVVMQSGRIYEGQPLQRRGAHTVNDKFREGGGGPETCPVHGGPLVNELFSDHRRFNLNHSVRAISLGQNVNDEVTDAQLDAAARWGAALILGGRVKRGAIWHGHRDVTAKACPGPKGYARIPELQRLTENYVAAGGKPIPEPKPAEPVQEADPMLYPDGRQARMKDASALYTSSAFNDQKPPVKFTGGDDWVTAIGATSPVRSQKADDKVLVSYQLRGDSPLGRKGESRLFWAKRSDILEHKPPIVDDCRDEVAAAVKEEVAKATQPLYEAIEAARKSLDLASGGTA